MINRRQFVALSAATATSMALPGPASAEPVSFHLKAFCSDGKWRSLTELDRLGIDTADIPILDAVEIDSGRRQRLPILVSG